MPNTLRRLFERPHVGFWESLALLTRRVDEQPGTRLPGSVPKTHDLVAVDCTLWATELRLSKGP